MKKPIIALTMGDPAGIGAELTLKVAMDCPQYHLVAVGDMGVLTQANRLLGNKVELLEIQDFDDAIFTDKKDNQLIVYQAGIPVNMPVTYGKLAKEYGMAAYNAIITAIDLAMQNKVQAVVTNPINKESLHLAGILQAGHTEIFAQRTQTERYSMLLVHGPLKVAHISTHVSLR
ncbi:MAG: 4-hydroxythreonine-4-phosphate dehydrogenase PdxA, partial [Sphaerochaetaceae bacterium]